MDRAVSIDSRSQKASSGCYNWLGGGLLAAGRRSDSNEAAEDGQIAAGPWGHGLRAVVVDAMR